jgi:hypothetical protein
MVGTWAQELHSHHCQLGTPTHALSQVFWNVQKFHVRKGHVMQWTWHDQQTKDGMSNQWEGHMTLGSYICILTDELRSSTTVIVQAQQLFHIFTSNVLPLPLRYRWVRVVPSCGGKRSDVQTHRLHSCLNWSWSAHITFTSSSHESNAIRWCKDAPIIHPFIAHLVLW